jgi:hypothetical protein
MCRMNRSFHVEQYFERNASSRPPSLVLCSQLRKPLIYEIPIDHVVESCDILRPAILILQIVGMLPNVDTEERLTPG